MADNLVLTRAASARLPLIGVVSETESDRRAAPLRRAFREEAWADLAGQLAGLGIPLWQGAPQEILARLAAQGWEARKVYAPSEPGTEEKLEEKAWGERLQLVPEGGLFAPGDLPFRLADLPDLFTTFRRKVEPLRSRKPHPTPGIQAATGLASDPFLITQAPRDNRAVIDFRGGEMAGKARLESYLASGAIRSYKETRNRMVGANDSSKFSPWLALGCLGPHEILRGIEAHEARHSENDSTYWLKFELLWREFFRWVAVKEGAKLFRLSGIQGLGIEWQKNETHLAAWREGKTGYPLVDANMRELALTGWMSNRGRQNVASFFTKNLGLDWRLGAAWFEEHLLDYDVASNWGNWQYAAGVGNDAREFRVFNIAKQAKDYDPDGSHARLWLPDLRRAPIAPIVDFSRSASENRARYEKACRKR